MKVVKIEYPNIYTDEDSIVLREFIQGIPKVGDTLEWFSDDTYLCRIKKEDEMGGQQFKESMSNAELLDEVQTCKDYLVRAIIHQDPILMAVAEDRAKKFLCAKFDVVLDILDDALYAVVRRD